MMAIHQIKNKYLRRTALIATSIFGFLFCIVAGVWQGISDGYWVFREEILPIIESVW